MGWSSMIGAVAIGMLIAIAASLGGIFGQFNALIPRSSLVQVPVITTGFVLVWFSLVLWHYWPIHKALQLDGEALRSDYVYVRRVYRRVHRFPFFAAWLSFGFWVIGGILGALIVLADISPWIRWVAPAGLTLLGVGINVPQIYLHKYVLSRVAAWLRSEVPALFSEELPGRQTIAEKLRFGMAATLVFAMGMAFVAGYAYAQRLQSEERLAHLRDNAQLLRRVLSATPVEDSTEEGRQAFFTLLSELRFGETGGVVVAEFPDLRFVLNIPGVIEDERTRKAMIDGLGLFGEDYLRSVTYVSLKSEEVAGLENLSRRYLISLGIPHGVDASFLVQALIIYLCMLFGSFGVVFVLSQDIVRPLRAVVRRSERLAEGRLDTSIPVVTDDEIGDLARQIRDMVTGLRRMVSNLKGTFEQLSQAEREIVASGEETVRVSADQLSESEQTGRSIASLHGKIEAIVQRVGALSESIEAASSAGFELATTVGQVRETASRLGEEAGAIDGAMRDLDGSLTLLSKATEHLRESATETESAISRIDAAVAEVSQVAQSSEKLSGGVLERSKEGQETVLQVLGAIRQVNDVVGQAAGIVKSLGEKNVQVEQILDVVNNLADQANLLSFNAAIIAAQAGEQGSGFAVVAEEIRKLADQTAASIGEVSGLVSSIRRESRQAIEIIGLGTQAARKGLELAGAAGESLGEITRQAEESLAGVRRITAAAAEQAQQSAVVAEVLGKLREAAGDFVRTETDQRRARAAIIESLGRIEQLGRRVSRAADEQKRAADEVSRAITDVQQTMEAVLEGVQQEAVEAEQIALASERIRSLAQANADKAVRLEKLSARLSERASAIRSEIGGFEV
ncbi:MAG: methyl-accepting chemotaxis protein [Bdellovibrionota bacterium]